MTKFGHKCSKCIDYYYLKRFWCWYQSHIVASTFITFLILMVQIPHFFWGGDQLIQSGFVAGVNPITDFILYSIDLIEIPLIVKVFIDFIILKKR